MNEGTEKKDEGGAPEKYEAFKLPEGFELTEDAVKDATAIFKDLNLSQGQAQKLVDYYVKINQEAADAPFKLWEAQQKAWRDEIAADQNLGPRMNEIKTNFAKMLDSLQDAKLASDFREAMDFTGAGNNPAFIRAFDKFARFFTEGGSVQAGRPAPVAQPGKASGTGARALYPNLS